MAARNNWVFPDPDSPTTPTHSLGRDVQRRAGNRLERPGSMRIADI